MNNIHERHIVRVILALNPLVVWSHILLRYKCHEHSFGL